MSHERSDVAGAESFHSLEGNMCGTVMRGADALPGSKATSRANGPHRKLGDLGSDRNGIAVAGPHREGEEPQPMMNGHEKSDPAILAMKLTNKAEQPPAKRFAGEPYAAESVERRAGTKGMRTDEQGELAGERSCSWRRAPAVEETGAGCDGTLRPLGRALATARGGREFDPLTPHYPRTTC